MSRHQVFIEYWIHLIDSILNILFNFKVFKFHGLDLWFLREIESELF